MNQNWKKGKFFDLFIFIYPPDSQESVGGAIHRASNFPDLLPEIPMYCCPLEILIEIRMKFRTACQDQQPGKVPQSVFPKDTTE